MNGPLLSAVALATVAGSLQASGAENAADAETSREYLSLDRELEELADSLAVQEGGVKVNAWIKTNLIWQDSTTGGSDTLGTQLSGVRLSFSADVTEATKLKISIDGAKGTVELKDAFAYSKLASWANLTFGQYRAPILQSSSASDESLLFYERSIQGNVWKEREPGVMFDGKLQQFRWYAWAQNGGDGVGEDLLLGGHLAYDLRGPGIVKQEGGFGPDAETAITLGATYLDEGTLSDGAVMAFEALAVSGPIFFQGEVVDYDDGFTAGSVPTGAAKSASGLAGTTPWDLTAAFAFNPQWEAAVRYGDSDDVDDTSTIGLGLNYYVNGHKTKWQLNLLSTSSDDDARDTDKILLGLVLAV